MYLYRTHFNIHVNGFFGLCLQLAEFWDLSCDQAKAWIRSRLIDLYMIIRWILKSKYLVRQVLAKQCRPRSNCSFCSRSTLFDFSFDFTPLLAHLHHNWCIFTMQLAEFWDLSCDQAKAWIRSRLIDLYMIIRWILKSKYLVRQVLAKQCRPRSNCSFCSRSTLFDFSFDFTPLLAHLHHYWCIYPITGALWNRAPEKREYWG